MNELLFKSRDLISGHFGVTYIQSFSLVWQKNSWPLNPKNVEMDINCITLNVGLLMKPKVS